MLLPIIICRHHDVEWINSHTCQCRECGKQGHWTEEGFAIWIRAEPKPDSRENLRFSARGKVA